MMGVATILLVCLAAFAVVWLAQDVHRVRVQCGCGLHRALFYSLGDDDEVHVRSRLTELCPICRLQERAP